METIPEDGKGEKMNKQELKKAIQSQYPGEYSKQGWEKEIIPKIMNMSPDMRIALEEFLRTGTLSFDVQIEGFTIDRLMKEYGKNEVASMIDMHWLESEPEKAKAALERGIR